MTTQRDMVAQYMEDFGSISSWDAFKDLGITRLSARIYELKERGYIISTEQKKAKNRYGKPVKYFKYRITGRIGGADA